MEILVAILAGLVAGVINTLAGSGSFLTLPALIFLGLPSQVANGTNRIGILLAALVSVWTFRAEGRLSFRGIGWLIFPSAAGAVAGALIAVRLDHRVMDTTIAVLMLLMLAMVALRPDRWLKERPGPPAVRRRLATLLVFFAIGVYGGFIQAGVGLFLLAGLVLNAGFDLARANGVKNLLVLLFTIPAFPVFILHDQVVWDVGLTMAAAQCCGAFLAARFASRSRSANAWIRWLLIVVLAASAAKLLW